MPDLVNGVATRPSYSSTSRQRLLVIPGFGFRWAHYVVEFEEVEFVVAPATESPFATNEMSSLSVSPNELTPRSCI